MTLTRRQFNKSILVGILTAALAPKQIPELLAAPPPAVPKVVEGFMIDTTTKTIRYVGGKDKYFTVLEFHRWISDLFDEVDMMTEPVPTIRWDDQVVRMNGGWRITADTAMHLYDGSIIDKEHEEIWTSNSVIGE